MYVYACSVRARAARHAARLPMLRMCVCVRVCVCACTIPTGSLDEMHQSALHSFRYCPSAVRPRSDGRWPARSISIPIPVVAQARSPPPTESASAQAATTASLRAHPKARPTAFALAGASSSRAGRPAMRGAPYPHDDAHAAAVRPRGAVITPYHAVFCATLRIFARAHEQASRTH